MSLKSIPMGSLPLKKRRVVLGTSFRPYKKANIQPTQTLSLFSLTSSSHEAYSPQTGGCHGKTSRSIPFCRRLPLYKGSRFCKLHYLQQKKKVEEPKALLNQDKRFTGADNEIRCTATTTRGRACAYVAVGSTQYCYLHADYDANPPPRRTTKDSEKSQKPKKFCRRRTSAKLAEKHAASKTPLLSMISTEQWYQKTVRVATGPLTGRVGTVEKWGNGWVSVKIQGVGLHNRRSFELYMEEPEDRYASISPSPSDSSSEQSDRSSMARSSTPASIIKISASSGDEESIVMPETPRPETHLVTEGLETPLALKTALSPESVPKVTPFGSDKPMAMTVKPGHLALQLPEDYGDLKGMVFRPSMSERAKENTADVL